MGFLNLTVRLLVKGTGVGVATALGGPPAGIAAGVVAFGKPVVRKILGKHVGGAVATVGTIVVAGLTLGTGTTVEALTEVARSKLEG